MSQDPETAPRDARGTGQDAAAEARIAGSVLAGAALAETVPAETAPAETAPAETAPAKPSLAGTDPAGTDLAGTDPAQTAADAAAPLPALVYRGRAFKALALRPEAPLPAWLRGLDAALERQPGLFDGRAVVLDLAAVPADAAGLAALRALLGDLDARSIRVLGLEGWSRAEGLDGLPPLLAQGRLAKGLDLDPAPPEPEVPPEPVSTSLTVEGSLRSGQSVFHPTGDVTVTGSVSSGAEILAGGSIHVYGALRGRAIAGAARNPRARIYCRKFEPELLGIDRLVRTAEDMGDTLRGRPVQVWLDKGAIRTAGLD